MTRLHIHLNPALLKHPEDQPRTVGAAMGAYSGRKGSVVIDTTRVLNQLGNAASQAYKAYRKFIDDGRGPGHDDRYYQALDQRFLGDDKFIGQLAERAPKGEINQADVSCDLKNYCLLSRRFMVAESSISRRRDGSAR